MLVLFYHCKAYVIPQFKMAAIEVEEQFQKLCYFMST